MKTNAFLYRANSLTSISILMTLANNIGKSLRNRHLDYYSEYTYSVSLETPLIDVSDKLNTKTLRLTFDDGPKQTKHIYGRGPNSLRIAQFLFEHNISATFFATGQNIESDPELVREIYSLNHVIGNHSFTHPNLTKLPPAKLIYEIQRTYDAIRSAGYTGEIPFRPPYGLWNENCINAISLAPKLSRAHSGVFGWKIGSKYPDWLAWRNGIPTWFQFQLLKDEISQSNNVGVVLLHDMSANDEKNTSRNLTFQLVRKLVRWAKGSGIAFENKCTWKVSPSSFAIDNE